MESEAGVYHVINRGNYRSHIFRSQRARETFLRCLEGACERTGWLVHAWCVMSNHYHLAISTPRANLVEGMKWLQGTFAVRFNRHRNERGHLFQGRYKSLLVDPDGGLGPLCHYIHLNPVRAGLRAVSGLPAYVWTSIHWLQNPALRPPWYDPQPGLKHAGGLADTPAGRDRYLAYLEWLVTDEPAQKRQLFDRMAKGWVIGSPGFTAAMVREHRELVGHCPHRADELRASLEQHWGDLLDQHLSRIGRARHELETAGKSEEWKIGLAAQMKARSTVTNRWLSTNLHLGALHEVSRKVSQRLRRDAS